MENKGKVRENGITLVALVITIIILLILAGVAITALTQTGLFEKAKEAKNAMENAQNTENITLAEYSDKIESIISTSNRENNNKQYSLDEQEIGTWVDGKKIYRKVFHYNSSFYINENKWIDSGIKINDAEIILETKVFGGEYGVYSSIQSSINGTVGIDKGSLALFSNTSLYFDYIIIEYTKI